MIKRLIISVDELDGTYSVDMPDGAIDTNELLSTIDDLMGELLKVVIENQQEEEPLDENLFAITPKTFN